MEPSTSLWEEAHPYPGEYSCTHNQSSRALNPTCSPHTPAYVLSLAEDLADTNLDTTKAVMPHIPTLILTGATGPYTQAAPARRPAPGGGPAQKLYYPRYLGQPWQLSSLAAQHSHITGLPATAMLRSPTNPLGTLHILGVSIKVPKMEMEAAIQQVAPHSTINSTHHLGPLDKARRAPMWHSIVTPHPDHTAELAELFASLYDASSPMCTLRVVTMAQGQITERTGLSPWGKFHPTPLHPTVAKDHTVLYSPLFSNPLYRTDLSNPADRVQSFLRDYHIQAVQASPLPLGEALTQPSIFFTEVEGVTSRANDARVAITWAHNWTATQYRKRYFRK